MVEPEALDAAYRGGLRVGMPPPPVGTMPPPPLEEGRPPPPPPPSSSSSPPPTFQPPYLQSYPVRDPLGSGWLEKERDDTLYGYTAAVYWRGDPVKREWKSNYLLEFGHKDNPYTYETRYSNMLDTLKSIRDGQPSVDALYTELYNTTSRLIAGNPGCSMYEGCDDRVTDRKTYNNIPLMKNKLNVMLQIARQFCTYVQDAEYYAEDYGESSDSAQLLKKLLARDNTEDRQRRASREVNKIQQSTYRRAAREGDDDYPARSAKRRGRRGGGKKSRRKYNKKKKTRRKYRKKVNKSKQKKTRRTRRRKTKRTRRRNIKK